MGRKAYQRVKCSCGELVTFVPSESTGRLAPIEDRLDDGGNVVLIQATDNGTGYTYQVLSDEERATDPRPRHLNHWSKCFHTDKFRR